MEMQKSNSNNAKDSAIQFTQTLDSVKQLAEKNKESTKRERHKYERF